MSVSLLNAMSLIRYVNLIWLADKYKRPTNAGLYLTFSHSSTIALFTYQLGKDGLDNLGKINIQTEHKTIPNVSFVVSLNIYIMVVSELFKYRYIAIIK